MSTGRLIIILLIIVSAGSRLAFAESKAKNNLRGWEQIAARLIEDGVPEKEVIALYSSRQMPKRGPIPFKLAPKEPARLYSSFFKAKPVAAARRYLVAHQEAFRKSEQNFQVSRFVVCAILLIESHLGKNTGNHLVANRLSRVASIAEAENVKYNYKRMRKKNKTPPTLKMVQDRAQYLDQQFYPELRALFPVARKHKLPILSIKGSSAGAFGFPQFLPTSYLKFGVDGNGDGHVSLFAHEDSIASTANFLASFGWSDKAKTEAKRQVLWRYNHSDAYIDAVLKMAQVLEE